MSDPNDVWQNSTSATGNGNGNGAGNGDYAAANTNARSPRRDEGARSPRRERERSRSPAARPAAGNGDNRGRNEDGSVQNAGNNLHVSGLARSIGERELEEHFAKIGKVVKVQIMFDPHSQESRGFGFVMMDSPDDAAAAIEQYSGQPFDGKVMTVAHARRGRARTPTPGRYHGVKQETSGRYAPGGPGGGYGGGYDRPYQPRSYDSRYSDRGLPPRSYYDDRDRRYDERRYDDRRDDRRYDDRRDYGRDRYDDYRGGGGGGGGAPDYYYRSERGGGGGGGGGGYDRREERPRYADERPRY